MIEFEKTKVVILPTVKWEKVVAHSRVNAILCNLPMMRTIWSKFGQSDLKGKVLVISLARRKY